MGERGLFIGIEGGDGSGKGTQTELLYQRMIGMGKNVLKLSFPRYGQESAEIVGRYLDGQYGEAASIHADLASLPYAIDRFAVSGELNAHLNHPEAVALTDRYVASNMAHQGTKFDTARDRHEYYDRIMRLEYGVLRIPRPTISFVLLVPPATSQENVDKKDAATRSYTAKKRDIHEADANHLERAKANYEELCELYPDEFMPIECTDIAGKMKSREAIHHELWTRVATLL